MFARDRRGILAVEQVGRGRIARASACRSRALPPAPRRIPSARLSKPSMRSNQLFAPPPQIITPASFSPAATSGCIVAAHAGAEDDDHFGIHVIGAPERSERRPMNRKLGVVIERGAIALAVADTGLFGAHHDVTRFLGEPPKHAAPAVLLLLGQFNAVAAEPLHEQDRGQSAGRSRRTRQDRAQSLAIGRAKRAIAAVDSRDLLEGAVLAPWKVARQRRFSEGAEGQAAGEDENGEYSMHRRGVSVHPPWNSRRMRRNIWPISKSARSS